jgi:hypothetical protein
MKWLDNITINFTEIKKKGEKMRKILIKISSGLPKNFFQILFFEIIKTNKKL